MGIRPEMCDKITCALSRNLDFKLFSPKAHRRKTFGCRKFQLRSLTTLLMQLGKKQMDPTNAFVEIERQGKERQWAMGNFKSVSKKFKNFRLLGENWPKNYFWQKNQWTLLN